MEGLSIRFLVDMPEQGQLLLDCRHDPWLYARRQSAS